MKWWNKIYGKQHNKNGSNHSNNSGVNSEYLYYGRSKSNLFSSHQWNVESPFNTKSSAWFPKIPRIPKWIDCLQSFMTVSLLTVVDDSFELRSFRSNISHRWLLDQYKTICEGLKGKENWILPGFNIRIFMPEFRLLIADIFLRVWPRTLGLTGCHTGVGACWTVILFLGLLDWYCFRSFEFEYTIWIKAASTASYRIKYEYIRHVYKSRHGVQKQFDDNNPWVFNGNRY